MTALAGASSKICMYFAEWEGVSAEAGDDGSGVGESDVDGEGGGESSRERLGMA